MAIIPSSTQFIGIAASVNLTEKKSSQLNSETQPYTMQDIIDTASSPPAGTAGQIQFNGGSAFAADSNLFWDNTNKYLGVGTATPSTKITAQTTTAADGISLKDATNSLALLGKWFDSSGFIDLNQSGTPYTRIQASQSYINTPLTIGTATAISARLAVKGSGSTSATTSLLVQNSSGTTALEVKDDRSTNLNGTLNINTGITGGSYLVYVRSAFPNVELFSITENQNMYLNAERTYMRSNGTWYSQGQYGTNFYAQNWYPQGDERIGWNFGGNALGATGAGSQISLMRINPSIGNFSTGTTNQGNSLLISPTINQVNTGNHTIRGIYYNPTITSTTGTTHRAIETTSGNVIFNGGNVGVGTSTPGTNLDVVGTFRTTGQNDFLGLAAPGHVMARINDNGTLLRYNTFAIDNASGNAGQQANLAVGTYFTTAARLFVLGSGSTSATTSLLVQNSSADTILRLLDDGSCTIGRSGGTTLPLTIVGNSGVQAIIGNDSFQSPSNIFRYGNGALNFYGNNNNGSAFYYSFNNQQSSNTTTSSMIDIGGTWQNQNEFQFANLKFQPTYNFASNTQSTAIARGIYYNPTITNLRVAQHYAWQNTSGAMIVNSSTPNASAILQADSTTQGFLPPRLSTAQKLAIASPAAGLMVYDNTLNQMSYYNGSAWINF